MDRTGIITRRAAVLRREISRARRALPRESRVRISSFIEELCDIVAELRRQVALLQCVHGGTGAGGPAVRTLRGGGVVPKGPLAPRLRQVLAGLQEGHAEKEIAWQLGISRHTVHVYVRSLYRYFGVCSRAELMSMLLHAAVHPDGASPPPGFTTTTAARHAPALRPVPCRIS